MHTKIWHGVLRVGGKLLINVSLTVKETGEIYDDPTGWYGKEKYDKYRIGTFHTYGSIDILKKLWPYFYVETFHEICEVSGQPVILHLCTKHNQGVQIQKQYSDLANSKLGRIQINYWKKRSRRK